MTMARKLSKRSIDCLRVISKFPNNGYRGTIPWSTERILRDQKLVFKMGEEHGVSILRITDAGRAALAQTTADDATATPAPVTTAPVEPSRAELVAAVTDLVIATSVAFAGQDWPVEFHEIMSDVCTLLARCQGAK
jgi:hypothetical protein